MTSIGSNFGTQQSSAWSDLQTWQAKMKAADQQFEDNNSGLADTLLSSSVTQTQGVVDLVTQQVIARLQNPNKTVPLTGGNAVNAAGTVYQDPNSTPFDPSTAAFDAPVGGASSDVYWGVDANPAIQSANNTPVAGPTSAVYWGTPSANTSMSSSSNAPAMGSTSAVYWGTPSVNITV